MLTPAPVMTRRRSDREMKSASARTSSAVASSRSGAVGGDVAEELADSRWGTICQGDGGVAANPQEVTPEASAIELAVQRRGDDRHEDVADGRRANARTARVDVAEGAFS